MSDPLASVGSAVIEVIGLNLQGVASDGEARWVGRPVFDDELFWQPTGLGEKAIRLRLATRPHVMGGLSAWGALRQHRDRQDVVPFIRMVGLTGVFVANVGIRRLGSEESAIAPDGRGYRWACEVELVDVGRTTAGGFG